MNTLVARGIVFAGTIVVALALIASLHARAQTQDQGSKYYGVWLRQERDRHIEIAPCAGDIGPICGKIVRLIGRDGKTPLADQSALGHGGAPLVGTVVLRSCKPAGSGLKCAQAYIPSTGESNPDVPLVLEANDRLKVGRLLWVYRWTRVVP